MNIEKSCKEVDGSRELIYSEEKSLEGFKELLQRLLEIKKSIILEVTQEEIIRWIEHRF